jgi:hypothetical protein
MDPHGNARRLEFYILKLILSKFWDGKNGKAKSGVDLVRSAGMVLMGLQRDDIRCKHEFLISFVVDCALTNNKFEEEKQRKEPSGEVVNSADVSRTAYHTHR